MAGEKRSLPRFDPGSINLIRGSTWNAVMDYIERLRVRPSENIGVEVTANGTIITGKAGGGTVQECAFGSVYQSGANLRMRGGVVMGGTSNIPVSDTIVGTGPGNDEDRIWLKVRLEATMSDGVLLPGCELISASIEHGSTIPFSDEITADSPIGNRYADLGGWMEGKFIPSGCGNFQFTHCPGNITYIRG